LTPPEKWHNQTALLETRFFEKRRGMALPTENHALIGNTRTAAPVDSNGSIDWMCLPCFDSAALEIRDWKCSG